MEYPNNGAKRIQPREAPENGISRVRKSRKKLKKSSAPQGVTANNKKAGEGDERNDSKRALQADTILKGLRLGRKRNSQAHRVYNSINLTM